MVLYPGVAVDFITNMVLDPFPGSSGELCRATVEDCQEAWKDYKGNVL